MKFFEPLIDYYLIDQYIIINFNIHPKFFISSHLKLQPTPLITTIFIPPRSYYQKISKI